MKLRLNRNLKIIGAAVALLAVTAAAAGILHFKPGLRSSLAWRADEIGAYIRGVFLPQGGIPAADVSTSDTGANEPFQPGGGSFMLDDSSVPPDSQAQTQSLPQKVILTAPAFDLKKDIQDWNNCGPATLALALRMYGWQGDQFDIAAVIKPLQTDKNVNPEEMAAFVEQSGMNLTSLVRVNGSSAMIMSLLASGYPVIVEEAFTLEQAFWPGDDLWSAHYLLITGYDLTSKKWITQDSFYGPNRPMAMDLLEQTWKPFNRLFMVIYTPSQESAVTKLLGDNASVETSYQDAARQAELGIKANSSDAFAWFNLGSSLLALGDAGGAATAFTRAREIGLPQRMLRYQFGPMDAARETQNVNDLFVLTNYALNITPNSEEALTSKGWAYILSGQFSEARASFNRALEAHPGYAPALDGLDHLQ